MPKRIGIQAMVRIVIVIASASMASAQTSPKEDELPTGDVWISHAETVFVPRQAPGMLGEMPSANAPLRADIVPDAKNTMPLAVKLDITFTIRRADISSAKNRTIHHRRPFDHAGHSKSSRHSARACIVRAEHSIQAEGTYCHQDPLQPERCRRGDRKLDDMDRRDLPEITTQAWNLHFLQGRLDQCRRYGFSPRLICCSGGAAEPQCAA